METSARDRFNVLFKNYPLPPVPQHKTVDATEEVTNGDSAQGESVEVEGESQVEREAMPSKNVAEPVTVQAKDTPLMKPVKPTRSNLRALTNGQQEHIPGTKQDELVYVPGGIWSGGLAATQIDTKDDSRNKEPKSASNELVGRYCHFMLLTKYPYKYLQDPDDRVSQRFFAAEKVYQRNWTMYYIWGPDAVASKPLMLVPLHEAQQLIDEMNQEFPGAGFAVPPYPFTLSFYDDGTPLPQRLGGCVNSKADLSDLQNTRVHPPSFGHDQPRPSASKATKDAFDAWHKKLEEAYDADKKKKSTRGKSGRTGNPGSHPALSAETTFQLKRAQRYLGLRPKPPSTEMLIKSEKTTTVMTALDVSKPAPFTFDEEPVIITFDVEAYERAHNVITEVGVSTLDTRDIKNIAPGEQGANWVKHIRSRHFRIKGREKLRNTEFVHGDPEMFRFGVSEFVAIDEAADAVDSCFEHPYSAGFECDGPPDRGEDGNLLKREPRILNDSGPKDDHVPRNIILLGHAVSNDDAYLAQLGSSIFGKGNTMSTTNPNMSRHQRVGSSIKERLDTAVLHQNLTKGAQPMSLQKICFELDIEPWNMHNAGNDARYTLEALIKLVVKARLQETGPSDREAELEHLADDRVENLRKLTQEKLKLDEEKLRVNGTEERGAVFATEEGDPSGNITVDEAERRWKENIRKQFAEGWDDTPQGETNLQAALQDFQESEHRRFVAEEAEPAAPVHAQDDDEDEYPY